MNIIREQLKRSGLKTFQRTFKSLDQSELPKLKKNLFIQEDSSVENLNLKFQSIVDFWLRR